MSADKQKDSAHLSCLALVHTVCFRDGDADISYNANITLHPIMSIDLDRLDYVLNFICTPSAVLVTVPFSSDCMPYDVAAAL